MALYELNSFITTIEAWGLTDILLPFLLIFTIMFAVLQKTQMLGQDKREFNVVVALIISLLFVIPHATGRYSTSYDPVNIINQFIPGVSLVVVAVLMLFVILGIFGGNAEWFGKSPSAMIALLSIVAVVWIFGASANWWDGWNWFINFFGEDATSLIIIILVFGVIIWFITKSDSPTAGQSMMNKLGDIFKIKK
jgi:hypothetical protein